MPALSVCVLLRPYCSESCGALTEPALCMCLASSVFSVTLVVQSYDLWGSVVFCCKDRDLVSWAWLNILLSIWCWVKRTFKDLRASAAARRCSVLEEEECSCCQGRPGGIDDTSLARWWICMLLRSLDCMFRKQRMKRREGNGNRTLQRPGCGVRERFLRHQICV